MSIVFKPRRQSGFILHLGALLLNLAVVGFLILQALSQQERGFFILFLIASVIVFIPIPIVAYRLFALLRSRYTVDREGIGIQWGLREELIPMSGIEWVRLANDLTFNLPPPPLSVQGAVLGSRIHPDLGYIEFIASDASNLILIASRDRIYAISPKDVRGFFNAFSQSEELGSIAPISGKSSSSNFLISALLTDKVSRTLLLSGIILSFGLLILTSFVIPLHETIPLGFNPLGASAETSPSDRLLLLPLLSFLMLILDISLGAYLYRKQGFRIASYLTFAAPLIMPLSFFGLIILLIL
jgi:hypothetical protein